MSLRKVAALLAAFGLIVGAIGSGVGAQFFDSVTANEHISVGTFECKIYTAAPASAVIAPDGKSVSYTAPTIMSSAPGSAPFSFTVQNTGSIPDVLTVSTSPALSAPWSVIGEPFAPVPLASGAMHTYNTGIQWTELDNTNLGQQGTVTWTVNCGENLPVVIFDNHPNTQISNLPSIGVEAYSFAEFGGGATFAGTARNLATSTVTMSSWACETGSWTDGTCLTTPGHTYPATITFKVYAVSGASSVGALLASKTQTFQIPFRPSYDSTNCPQSTPTSPGLWYDGTNCKNGLASNITFAFPTGTILGNTAIFGIAYNTDNHGYAPIGGSGSPLDSLNIGMYPGTGDGSVATTPSVGSFLPDGLSAYLNDSQALWYLDDGAGGLGTFRLDTGPALNPNPPTSPIGPYGGFEPAVQITATN